jgi:hypothetical protein
VAPALQVMCVDAAFGVLGAVLAPATQASGRPGLNAALGWIQAAVSAAVIAVVGWAFAQGGATTQVLAIATTFLVLRVAFLICMGVITVRTVFHTRFGVLLGPSKPALLAAVAALAAGYGARLVMPAASPLIDTLVIVGMSGSAAGLVLLTRDPLVRGVLRRAFRHTAAADAR